MRFRHLAEVQGINIVIETLITHRNFNPNPEISGTENFQININKNIIFNYYFSRLN